MRQLASVLAGLAAALPAPGQTGKSTLPEVEFRRVFPELQFARPLWMSQPPDGTGRWFLIEQWKGVRVFENRPDAKESVVALDLGDRVNWKGRHNEEGVLALAFHPDFKKNRRLFLYYCVDNPRRTLLTEWTIAADDPNKIDPASEKILLAVDQPYGNHKGGTLLFGKDGFLYLSLGDGGAADDPHGNGQNLKSLLGKILRIDVDKKTGDLSYGIPKDNPFVKIAGARPEIWSYGHRNVWRMSFDRKTGDLWAGDVGQNLWEEVDLVRKGGNFGWNLREGTHPFEKGPKAPEGVKFVEPVIDYHHKDGLSVTGGYVYRGDRLKKLQGAYLYGDYATGALWALRWARGKLADQRMILKQTKNISSFAEGEDGEVYLLTDEGKGSDRGEGKIYMLDEKP